MATSSPLLIIFTLAELSCSEDSAELLSEVLLFTRFPELVIEVKLIMLIALESLAGLFRCGKLWAIDSVTCSGCTAELEFGLRIGGICQLILGKLTGFILRIRIDNTIITTTKIRRKIEPVMRRVVQMRRPNR